MTYTLGQGTTRTDEETSTDGTTNGNHVQMTRLHSAIEFDNTLAIVALLEGRSVETISGHEALILVRKAALGSTKDLALSILVVDSMVVSLFTTNIGGAFANGGFGCHVGLSYACDGWCGVVLWKGFDGGHETRGGESEVEEGRKDPSRQTDGKEQK